MQVAPVDPRDVRWEDPHPVFRVYFWDERAGWSSDGYQITGADVSEVLEWARAELPAKGTEFTLYLVIPQSEGVGVVVLAGRDASDRERGQVFPPAR